MAIIARPVPATCAQWGKLARRWCEPCHVVAADQREVTGKAPPFSSIATRSGFDAARIATFLLDPHPKKPDMSLTRFEGTDLAAYIAGLAKRRSSSECSVFI
jgi:hypothetical protein